MNVPVSKPHLKRRRRIAAISGCPNIDGRPRIGQWVSRSMLKEMLMAVVVEQALDAARVGYDQLKQGYAHSEERPLAAQAGPMAAFGVCAGASAGLVKRQGLPDQVGGGDVGLGGIATYKGAQLLTRDRVTTPLRAPFTEFKNDASGSEVDEEHRGVRPRRAIGELFRCQFCTGQWVVTGFLGGQLRAPRPTRVVASLMGIRSLADALGYLTAAEQIKVKP